MPGERAVARGDYQQPLRQRPGPQVLDQVNVGMAPRAALNPPVLGVARSTVEVGSLEAVRGNNHLCTATSPRLSLCRRKQSAPQASTAQVSADPQEFDVAATSPRPTRQPRFEASVASSLRSAQQSSVVEPRRVGVELVDAIRESGVESVVDVTDGDGIVSHDCMMTGLRRPRAVRLRMLGRVGDYRPSGDRRPRARTILVEVEPTVEERLARIREVAHRSLRYYATAYLNTDVAEEHVIAERDLLMAYMTDLANVMALLDGNELDDRAMLAARHEVLSRYIEAAGEDPWVPPTTPGGS